MHAGNITSDSAAGRVYQRLARDAGKWVDAWQLALDAETTAVSTRVSEVRRQVAALGMSVEHEERREAGKRRQYYRLVPARGQMLMV